jgi:vacuolar-type H+-ATPase subunit I/STV1
LSAQGVTVRRTLPTRTRIGAAVASVLVLLVASACGGGGGGGGGGGDAADLAAQAATVGQLLDQIEALPTSATTAKEYSTQLATIRDQIETTMEAVQSADAPDELKTHQNQLANTLRSLRTQLNRVQSLADAGDLDTAIIATQQLLSVGKLRATIATIEQAAGVAPAGTSTGTG